MLTVVLIGFCFGANFVLYASAISRYFGTGAFPRLYPICFGYGVAGVTARGWADGSPIKPTYHTAIHICIAP